METDSVETGSALLSELGLQKVFPLNIPTDMPGPANINIKDLGLHFEEDTSIPLNIEAPESTQPSAPESAAGKEPAETEKDMNEHEDIVVESDPAAMLGCFFTDSNQDFDKPPKTPGGESDTGDNFDQTESLDIKAEQISIDSLGSEDKDGSDQLDIKNNCGPTNIPIGGKVRYLNDELGWNESKQSFGTKNHERGGVVLRISLPRLEEVDMRNLIKKERSKASKKRSKQKKRSDSYVTRRMYYLKKRRKCDFCRKFFFNETCLLMHKTSNCPQLWPYPCEKCGNRYKNKGKLREHVLSMCGRKKVFACKVCNKSYLYERQLLEHITPVCKNSLLFRCDVCNYTAKSLERLNEHVLAKCDKEKVFKCDTCEKRYVLKSQLIEHLTPICRALRRFKCEHCEMIFKKVDQLNLHKSNAHGIGNEILCDKCGVMVNGSEQFKAHSKKHRCNRPTINMYDLEEKSFLCKFCGKCYKSKITLRGHLRTHTVGHFIACTICGKTYSRFSIRSHMKTHASLKKAFNCHLCQKGFLTRRDLQRHMAVHSNDKPHSCRDCGKSFASIDQLRSHSVIHTGLKSHFCNMCGNSYSNRISLSRHIQRVHKKKKNNCAQCGQSFQAREGLLEHHRHEPNCAETKCDVKPYVCNDCETCFDSPESFYCHTEIKSDDQPLGCNTCGKFFPRIACLNSHLLSHQQTINCDRCGESFGDSLSLGLHDAICGIIQNVSNNEFTLSTCDDKFCICNQCGGQFNNIYDLTCHAMTHISNEPLKFESVELKSETDDNLSEISCNRKQIVLDVPLKFENVNNFSLPDTSNKEFLDLTQVSDMPVKFEGIPSTSLQLDDFPDDSHTLQFNSNIELTLNYERVDEVHPTFENYQNSVENETPVHQKSDVAAKKFTCNVCGRILAHSRSLRRHMTRVHPESQQKNSVIPPATRFEFALELKPVMCKGCGSAFDEMQHLMNHVCIMHPTVVQDNLVQNNSLTEIVEPTIVSPVPLTELKPVLCNSCGRAFSEMRHLKRHICKLNSPLLQVSQTEGKVGALTVRERKPVNCEGCKRTFSEMRHLKRHICKVRSNETQINGSHNNSFSIIEAPSVMLPKEDGELEPGDKSGVVLNMPLLNSSVLPDLESDLSTIEQENTSCEAPKADTNTLECQKCCKKFSSSSSLKKHMASVNCQSSKDIQTPVGPISCDVCGKTFQQKYNLNRHKSVHSSETPYKCDFCKVSFKHNHTLQNHMIEAHHLPSSESSFRCDICEKLFASKSRLNDHKRRSHKKLECVDCELVFNNSSKLSKHRMNVHGEKSKCRICQLVCTSVDNLTEHLRAIHKEVIDESASPEDLISMYRDENSSSEVNETIVKEVSSLETKIVELKLPLNDKNMLMFEAYESLLLETCPLEPSVSVKKVNEYVNHESSEEELVKLEYIVGS